MILEALRDRTKHLHERAERAVDLPARLHSRDAYAGLLARFHGFYAPLEDRLAAVAGYDTVGLDLGPRLKAGLLRDDLDQLGYTPASVILLTACTTLPAVRGLAESLGCLYVMEGATLGGQVVRREVGRTLGFGPGTGCSFFASYGDRVGAMWAGFRRALTAFAARHPGEEEAVVATAVETFARFEEWVA